MKRKCVVCGTNNKKKIYTQKYLLPHKRSLFTYDVVICKECGFVFADNIPSQREYDKYYQNSNKYTYSKNIPKGLITIYKDLFFAASNVIKTNTNAFGGKNARILDIGCSIGTFLNMFKEHGFKRIYGIEPSLECCRLAKELYGLEVFSGLLSEYRSDHKFNVIIMTGVLEHISDFNNILPHVSRLLHDSGIFMAAVPDADKFSLKPLSPFDEFSVEHINYFTKTSLSNLMTKYRLQHVLSESIDGLFYDSNVLVSFYKKCQEEAMLQKDIAGNKNIKNYIAACNKKLMLIENKFNKLIKSNEELIVWGVGSLTYRLLASTKLSKLNIKIFIDRNQSLWGQKIMNKKIYSPDYLNEVKTGTVFISSHIYGSEIRNMLRTKYHFTGDIIQV